jgi:phosphohistidine phosphatase SixA
MVFWIVSVVGLAIAYLFGSTPTGYLAGKLLKGIDIREHGSKSIGATNVLRTLGKWPALVVLLVDVLKGVGRSSLPAGFILGSIHCRPSRHRQRLICKPGFPTALHQSSWNLVQGVNNMLVERRQFLAISLGVVVVRPAEASESMWTALRSKKAIALLRHAEAPGIGDPPGFTLGDCSTQRNLSAEGRAQAVATGERFRANGIAAAAVYSSQWCRCLHTARLLDLGNVVPLELLNSFFGERSAAAERTAALLAWLRRQRFSRPAVLVTHQVNITGLTGESVASGEMIVVQIQSARPTEVLGHIPPK